ncbi:MAG: hypothetical protein K2K14_09845 [Ruminococcus sp.]|nr:hypothetical protein [Ruminococcus sp.]
MKKIIIIFSVVSALILLLYAISEHSIKGKISSINSSAMIHYKSFTNGLIELDKYPDINVDGENYISGECRDFLNYSAYKGDSVKSDILIYGAEKEKANGYWAVKIIDGEVKETWASNYPLKKEQLTEKQISLNPLETILTSLKIYKPQFIGYYKE